MEDSCQFCVGDRVQALCDVGAKHTPYATGTVVVLEEMLGCGVGFDEDIGGHDCMGHCKAKHGWFVFSGDLVMYPDGHDLPDIDVPDEIHLI